LILTGRFVQQRAGRILLQTSCCVPGSDRWYCRKRTFNLLLVVPAGSGGNLVSYSLNG